MRKVTLQVFRGARPRRLWYWRLRAGNGRVIADGAEGYSRKDAAVRAAWTTVHAIRRAVVTVI